MAYGKTVINETQRSNGVDDTNSDPRSGGTGGIGNEMAVVEQAL